MANDPFQSARKNNFKFKFLSFCHAHNLQLPSTTGEEVAASKRMVFYAFYAQKVYLLGALSYVACEQALPLKMVHSRNRRAW